MPSNPIVGGLPADQADREPDPCARLVLAIEDLERALLTLTACGPLPDLPTEVYAVIGLACQVANWCEACQARALDISTLDYRHWKELNR